MIDIENQFNFDELSEKIESLDKRLARSGWIIIILTISLLFMSLYIITHRDYVPNQTHPNPQTQEEIIIQINELNQRIDNLEEKIDNLENNR